jgi:hypothetical protein
MTNNSTKKQKMAFPVGLIVVILAAIGLVTVIVAGVKGIDMAIDKSRRYEEYEKILTPVVLIDPDSFDDVTKAQMSQLMEISLWSLLKNDVAPDSFPSNESGLAIPKDAVEKEFIELFGTEITPVHGTIEGYGIDFTYDTATETYTVPLTGVTFPFLSNGGSSMIGAWGLLAFIKAADTRQNASFAVKLVKGGQEDE